ncbi:hypothetical protein GCM10012288_25030 [Malaciobacter pacificus]|uniref:SH3 domain-containing protein n=1 Tax=Malaciobacter pacificus TaxID=1080223 RepID=UPI00166A7C43|nr:SH3 domain-containing protein [Malaciobacter pacificus]GGD49985.1 hypothetical protein GCM10012288_25030 [Malaciobacter pacificus]
MAKKSLFENSTISKINTISKQLNIATMPLSSIGLASSKLFGNSALSQINTISKQLNIATMPLSSIGLASSKLFENSTLSKISTISEQLSIATMPLSSIGLASSKLFENSTLSKISTISEQLSIATMPLSSIGLASSKLFGNNELLQLEAKLKFISENIIQVTKSDIEELSDSEIETFNTENISLIEILEELKIETINNKLRFKELNQQLEELLKTAQKQTNSIIINIILGLMVSIIFTYFVQPVVNHIIFSKSQINKILVPEIKRVLKSKISNYRVVVVESYLNVRNKPKLKSKVIFHLTNGDLVEIINKQKNWTLIKKYDSEYETIIQGWVNTRYLLKIK